MHISFDFDDVTSVKRQLFSSALVGLFVSRIMQKLPVMLTRTGVGTCKDNDKDFTYNYLLQVAAKPTIAIKQQQWTQSEKKNHNIWL